MLRDQVERCIDDCIARGPGAAAAPDAGQDGEFDALALAVFAEQFERVPLYRRLCELRGALPAGIEHWSQIPAAPADLFKEDLQTGTEPGARTFLSSGTTQGPARRSLHRVSPRSYELYRRCSLAQFRAMVLPDSPGPMSTLLLGPSPATHESSSLGHMYQFVIDAFAHQEPQGSPASPASCFGAGGDLDIDGAVEWLRASSAASRPVLILALTSTITAVFAALRKRGLELRLPADSRLVDTGGSKGGRTLSRNGILKAAWRFLHIPAYLCVAEYGMTELLSQFYDDALASRWSGGLGKRAKVGPRWSRSLVVDPATLTPVAAGQRGILRHFDLANFESIAAVQTLDLGVAAGRGFEVLGRAAGADTRGCSELMSSIAGAIPGSKPAGEQS